MPTNFTPPTKCFIQDFNLNGVDLRLHVQSVKIFETVCKPYITGQATIIDTNNVLNNMGIVGGEPVSVTINSARSIYHADLHILAVHGQQASISQRAQIYTIEMIGKEYFGDRANLVQQAFKGITGTNAIQKIHNQFVSGGLRIPVESIGLLGKDNSYIVSSTKPFKAINDIRKLLTFPGYQSGSSLYFRDAEGMVLAPLEHLFKTMSSQETFIQEATWGKSWMDIARSENAIISAATLLNENQTGRTGLQDISSKLQGERKVIDMMTNKKVFDLRAGNVDSGSLMSPISNFLGNIVNTITGGHGGEHNYYVTDAAKMAIENTRHTEREKLFQALVAGGPQLLIKVPIQPGLRCTVGKGITAKLLPPIGDVQNASFEREQMSGEMLVIDLCHEANVDERMMMGTTTMRVAKGGFA